MQIAITQSNWMLFVKKTGHLVFLLQKIFHIVQFGRLNDRLPIEFGVHRRQGFLWIKNPGIDREGLVRREIRLIAE